MQNLVLDSSSFKRKKNLPPQVHAKKLDKILGYKSPKIEVKLLQKYRAYDRPNEEGNKKQHYRGTQTWIGLHPQALQTPYNDIYDALFLLKDFEVNKVIDIGAGYGRVGIVMNAIFPEASFIGYEILKPRTSEANRIFDLYQLDNCKVELQNVLEENFKLPHAQVYFIYDFSELDDICTILDQLSDRFNQDNFFLISRGERIDFLIERKYKEFWKANGYLTCGELKIYSSTVDLNRRKSNEHWKSKIL